MLHKKKFPNLTRREILGSSLVKFTIMNLPRFLRAIPFAPLLSLAALAQFSPGPNPLSGSVSTSQTIASGTGTVNGTLMVSGTANAINVTGTATVVNNGSILQTGTGRSLRNNTNGVAVTLTNNAGALIQAADGDAFQMNTANSSVTLNNFGRIISLNASAGGSQAIDWNAITTASNTLNNFSTGLLKAFEADAVRPGVNGVVNNAGTILAVTATGSSSDGVDAQTNSGITVNNTGSGVIEGGRHGITGGNTSGTGAYSIGIMNQVGATIQGDNGSGINIDGLNGNEIATIANSGMITGNGHDIGDGTGHDGDGVDVDGLVNLTNSGTIKSINSFGVGGIEASEGVTVGGGTIVNSGTIEGDVAAGNSTAVGRGVTLAGVDKDSGGNAIPIQGIYANSSITNSGLIKGQTDSGIAVLGPATGFTVAITNTSAGVIEGGGATAAAIQTGSDNDTITNAGQIIADSSGRAIDLGAGDDTLMITGGAAKIVGSISGGSGTNSLIFDPGAGNPFNYGGTISNFSSAEVKSGTVTLLGGNLYGGNTTLSGGTLLVDNASGSATGTGNVTVKNSSTLGGNGRVGGSVELQAGGTIAPGDGIGFLSIGGNLSLVNASRFLFELGATGATSDRIDISGALIFTGTGSAEFDFINDGVQSGVYTLLNFGSSSGLSLSDFSLGPTSGLVGNFVLSDHSLSLNVTAVPEVSPMAPLLACAALGFAVRTRRRWFRAARAKKASFCASCTSSRPLYLPESG
jgi:hypothetical protein